MGSGTVDGREPAAIESDQNNRGHGVSGDFSVMADFVDGGEND